MIPALCPRAAGAAGWAIMRFCSALTAYIHFFITAPAVFRTCQRPAKRHTTLKIPKGKYHKNRIFGMEVSMAKVADQYFKLDPWKIIEEGFDPDYSRVSESIFSLGNEYMGVRGYFEEGTTCDTLLGSYFNGIYENGRKEENTAYKGIVTRTHFMVNSVDWLYTRISLDGEQLDMKTAQMKSFIRTLDMRTGVLTR